MAAHTLGFRMSVLIIIFVSVNPSCPSSSQKKKKSRKKHGMVSFFFSPSAKQTSIEWCKSTRPISLWAMHSCWVPMDDQSWPSERSPRRTGCCCRLIRRRPEFGRTPDATTTVTVTTQVGTRRTDLEGHRTGLALHEETSRVLTISSASIHHVLRTCDDVYTTHDRRWPTYVRTPHGLVVVCEHRRPFGRFSSTLMPIDGKICVPRLASFT